VSKRKATQLIIVLLLAITLGFTSTAAFAYWSTSDVTSNVTINFTEENAELLVEQTSESFEGMLVPKHYVMYEGEVEQVEVTYEVEISRELINEVNLVVEALNIKINDLDTYSHLVNIEINGSEEQNVYELFNDTVLVTIIVTIDEPIDALEAEELGLDESLVNVEDSVAAYEAIHGQTITFDLAFSIEPKIEE